MPRRVNNYGYLLRLFSQVDTYLNEDNPNKKLLPEALVGFCTVSEKVMKIHLYKKSKILAYDISKLKDTNQLTIIALGKERDQIPTIQIDEVISRFQITHKKYFTEEEFEVLRDLYKLRNCFIHSYKPDSDIDYNSEDIVTKMGTLWPTVAKLAASALGKEKIRSSKPKKTYTEEELRKVLIEEIKKKIEQPVGQRLHTFYDSVIVSGYQGQGKPCPRCGAFDFSKQKSNDMMRGYTLMGDSIIGTTSVYNGFSNENLFKSNVYKCNKCNLELTEKEYELYMSDLSLHP